MFRNIASSI